MNEFIQRIEKEIIKYNDIQSVLARLVQQKFMASIKSLFESIFQNERQHIINVLSKQQKDKIFESYSLNLTILKSNLQAITNVVIEDIYLDFKQKALELKNVSQSSQLITIIESEEKESNLSQRCTTDHSNKKPYNPLSKLTLKCLLKK